MKPVGPGGDHDGLTRREQERIQVLDGNVREARRQLLKPQAIKIRLGPSSRYAPRVMVG